MKKSVKQIIGLGVVLAALGGGAAALMLTDPDKDPENESSTSESEIPTDNEQQAVILIRDDKVTGTDPDTGADLEGVVEKVSVSNEYGEFDVVHQDKAGEDGGILYTIDGYQDIVMNDALVGTLANNANGMTSSAVIEENCTDLEKFGLSDPSVTVKVEYETGTECTLYIGAAAPTGDVTYVMTEGVDTVYTVRDSLLANFRNKPEDFVELTMLEAPEKYPIVESLRIEREDMDSDIYLEYDKKADDSKQSGGTSSTHLMIEPTDAYLSVERSSDIITGMFGLEAQGIYCIHCEESDIAEAGLKTPFCTVTMKCDDGNTHTLLFSEPFTDDENGKCCYAMFEGGNVIFTVKADSARWVTVEPVDIASTIFIASYVWNIDEFSVTAGDDEYAFEISRREPDKEIENLSASDFKTTLNGSEFDSERFRKFYSFIITANAESFALDEKIPSGKPMAAIKYHDNYDDSEKTIEFYDYSAMTSLIAVNGESKFFITKSFVETLIENAEKLDGEEEFVTTWR